MNDNPPEPLPDAAITAALASLSKHSDMHLWLTSAEGTVGGLLARRDLLAIAVEAAAPALRAQGAATERARIRHTILRCRTCDEIHEPQPNGSWAGRDGHTYRQALSFHQSTTDAAYTRRILADLLDGDGDG